MCQELLPGKRCCWLHISRRSGMLVLHLTHSCRMHMPVSLLMLCVACHGQRGAASAHCWHSRHLHKHGRPELLPAKEAWSVLEVVGVLMQSCAQSYTLCVCLKQSDLQRCCGPTTSTVAAWQACKSARQHDPCQLHISLQGLSGCIVLSWAAPLLPSSTTCCKICLLSYDVCWLGVTYLHASSRAYRFPHLPYKT